MVSTLRSENRPDNLSKVQLLNTSKGPQLLVNGRPFVVLGGELANSSASDIKYMDPVWPRLKSMHLNTLLAPVYWEFLEPEEGKFDFTLVDYLIDQARAHDMKLVLLWFGTWKNSMSSYAPVWMKKDHKRFPRTRNDSNRSQEIFSVFGTQTLEADKKAFSRLMKHIKEYDGQQATVIMVQVENEVGMLPTAREFSSVSDAAFAADIPRELATFLTKSNQPIRPELNDKWVANGKKTKGSWEAVFGSGLMTEEIFQAWHYAKFVNEVAAAGRKEYDLPMFVNASLPRPGKRPGEYPSAGPLPHLMDVWKVAGPSIHFLSPDFYNPDTQYWCNLYTQSWDNPLFIPEMNFDETAAAKAFFTIGHYRSLGFSPFSIDSEDKPGKELGKAYELLSAMMPTIAGKKWLGMDGFMFDSKDRVAAAEMVDYKISIAHYNTMSWASAKKDSVWTMGGCIVIQVSADEFLIGGTGAVVRFECKDSSFVPNFLSVEEILYEDGKQVVGRRMNGDENHQGRQVHIPTGEYGLQRVRLYRSPAIVK